MHHCPQCSAPLPEVPLLPDPDGGFDGHFACGGCQLVSLMPMQTPEQIEALYADTGNWQLLSSAETEVGSKRRLAAMLAALGTGRPGRLFEVGADRGEFLATARSAGWEVEGLEPAARGRAMAREHFGIELRGGMFRPDSIGDGSFDALCAWDVLEHCLEPDRVLAAMLSWVRPGGIVVLAIPHIDGIQAKLLRARWRYRMAPMHVHQLPLAWLEAQATAHGARIADVKAFAKVHAVIESALPQKFREALRRQMPVAASETTTTPGAATPRKRRLRSLLRGAVLRVNQTPVPLPLGDLIEITLRRN